MAFKTYKQADSRWGKKNYNGSSTMATAGCGPTSCAMIIYGVDGKTTPIDTMKYMQKHGYAIRNNGTAWNGIPSCLKAFGVKDVAEINVDSSMTKVWEKMKKGYVGVFLFRSGSRGGITWTTSGHYVAVTDYKIKNGKHYVYTRDSGGRNHTGWYCYETQMKGLIPKVWLGYIPGVEAVKKPTSKYAGTIPTPTLKKGNKGASVKNLQKFLNWYGAGELTVDGDFGAKTKSSLEKFQTSEGITADGIYGQNSYKKAKAYKMEQTKAEKLIAEATKIAWAEGTPEPQWKYKTGKPTEACKTAMQKRGYKTKVAYSDCGYFQNSLIYGALGKKVKVLGAVKKSFKAVDGFDIVIKGGPVSESLLKPGDIIRYKKKNGAQHVLMYYGDGCVCEAGRKTRFGVIRKTDKYNDTKSVKASTLQVLRVKA